MEEILASIRRIISEDDAPAEGEAPAEAAHAAAPPPAHEDHPLPDLEIPAAEPPPLEAHQDDVLELTDRVDPEPEPIEPEGLSDLEFLAPPQPRAEVPADLPPMHDDEHLVGDPAAWSAASHFEKLERGIMMPAAGRTLEDVVRELLRPMIRAWLDENLPSIVEAKVAAEIERVARLRRQ